MTDRLPLPIRSCVVTYLGEGRGLHYMLETAAGVPLTVWQPAGSTLDLYTADQMHAYSDAENAALKALHHDCATQLRVALQEREALAEQVRVLQEALAEIREVWAGAEAGEPVTAQEAYAITLCKQMYVLACAGLKT